MTRARVPPAVVVCDVPHRPAREPAYLRAGFAAARRGRPGGDPGPGAGGRDGIPGPTTVPHRGAPPVPAVGGHPTKITADTASTAASIAASSTAYRPGRTCGVRGSGARGGTAVSPSRVMLFCSPREAGAAGGSVRRTIVGQGGEAGCGTRPKIVRAAPDLGARPDPAFGWCFPAGRGGRAAPGVPLGDVPGQSPHRQTPGTPVPFQESVRKGQCVRDHRTGGADGTD